MMMMITKTREKQEQKQTLQCRSYCTVVVMVAFFFACKDFGRMFDTSFPARAFFFFKVEIRSRTLIPLFRPGSVHSSTAS